jgi:plastocyanin
LTLSRASRWAVASLLAASCAQASVATQDENASTREPRAASKTPASASPSVVNRTATVADQETIEVLLGDHFVDPQMLVVKAGTTVKWRNSSGTHDVTSRDGTFRSPPLGDSFSYTFTQPGRYPFFCTFHPHEMRGEIVVEPVN